jgi:phage shock protein E
MLGFLKRIFKSTPKVNYKELVDKGAIVLDVRSKSEYSGGHVKGSMNISVDQLDQNLSKLHDKNKPVIVCCGTGMRSKAAASLLKASGYREVYDAGAWTALKSKLVA